MSRTWGEMRLELVREFPGFDLGLLDSYLNGAHNAILDHQPWPGLHAEDFLTLSAAVNVGTVAVTNGSREVIGTGTAWTADLGWMSMHIYNRPEVYLVNQVNSGTSLFLDRGFEGPTGTEVAYCAYKDVYQLPTDCKYLTLVFNPHLQGEVVSKKLTTFSGFQFALGDPLYYELAPDTSEAFPPVRHQIRIYPAPRDAYSLTIDYEMAPLGFYPDEGDRTQRSPLPWISTDAILAYAKAKCKRKEKDYPGAEIEEGQYQKYLDKMISVEAQRDIAGGEMEMQRSYTKHRTRRWAR